MEKRGCKNERGIAGITLFVISFSFYFQPLKTIEYKAER